MSLPGGKVFSKSSIAIFLAVDATLIPDAPVVPLMTVKTSFSAVPSFGVINDSGSAKSIIRARKNTDPMVLAHSRALKTGGNTAVIEADLRDPASILDHPPHACAHRLQPAPGRPAGGRPALHRRQRRSVRDCRVHPRRPATRKPPRDIARDGRHPPGRLGRQGSRALPEERGVRVNAPRPGRHPPVHRRTRTHRAGARPGTALAPRRTRITRCQQGVGSRRRRTRNPAGGNTARLTTSLAAMNLPG